MYNNNENLNWSRDPDNQKKESKFNKEKKYRHPKSNKYNNNNNNNNNENDGETKYKNYRNNKNFKNYKNKFQKNYNKKVKETETYDINNTCKVDDNIYKIEIFNENVPWIELLNKYN